MSTGWDSGMLKKLKALVGKGLSTAEMGKKLGMSKNAVVGKLNRLGWNMKASEPTKKKKEIAPKAKSTKSIKPTKTVKNTKIVEKKEKITKKIKVSAKSVQITNVKKTKTDMKKPAVAEKDTKTVVKTASKKNKKDLALHELLIQHALQMANLKPNQCRWPIGDPDSDNFHFCGESVFPGKPYCYEHCRQAYQFVSPKKK